MTPSKNPVALSVVGCGLLVVAISLTQVIENDFALGTAYGASFGIAMLGIFAMLKAKIRTPR